MKCFKKM